MELLKPSAAATRAVDLRRVRFEWLDTSQKPGILVGWNLSRIAVHAFNPARDSRTPVRAAHWPHVAPRPRYDEVGFSGWAVGVVP